MISDFIEPLIATFGLWFVVGTWLFVPSVLSGAFLTGINRPVVAIPTFLVPYAIWPVSLWILKITYEYVPIRVVFGVDMTDLSVFGYLVIMAVAFLSKATEELTGALKNDF